MNQPLLVNIKREDFGFAVAKALAIVAWILAARNLDELLVRLVPYSRDDGWSYVQRTLTTRAPTLVYVAALGYIGYRLWTGAPRFGGAPSQGNPGDAMVMASQKLLVCGLAMGVAAYPLVHGVISIIPWILWIAQSSDVRSSQSTPTIAIFSPFLDIVIGAVVFGRAYAIANRVQVPDLEYDPAETPS
jgi:hypothetical protein